MLRALLLLALSLPPALHAQPAKKLARVGVLSAVSADLITARLDAFRLGLRDLGYVEGQSIFIESKHAASVGDLAPLAAELVKSQVDVILTTGPASTAAAVRATRNVPIVMAFHTEAVAALPRPGGNVTGLSTLAPEIAARQIELLKEMLPTLSRVAIIGTVSQPGTAEALKHLQGAARRFNAQIEFFDVPDTAAIERAFLAASKWRADALVVLSSAVLNENRQRVAALATQSRLPAGYASEEFALDGGMMYYGVSLPDLFRRSAGFVDKILRGSRPADLPIEQAIKFELVFNRKAAQAIGFTIPRGTLSRADRVIQ